MKLPSYCKGLPQYSIRHEGNDFVLALDRGEHDEPELYAVFPDNGGSPVDITDLMTAAAKAEMLRTAVEMMREAA
nr:hypothetical protein [Chromobacterium sp. ASV5]